MRHPRVAVLPVCALFAACAGDGIIEASADTAIEVHVTELADLKPLVFGLEVELGSAAEVTVEYWTEGGSRLRVRSAPDTTHRLLLARLLPNVGYEYAVNVGDTSVVGSFTTDTLPDDLKAVGLISTGESTAPLIMLELRVPTFQGFVAIDSLSRVVWFHRTRGSSWGWTRRANGNYVFLDATYGLEEVTPDGEVLATLASAGGEVIHHDVIATPENTLYFMTRHPETVNDTTWVGEQIWEWNPDTGELLSRWNAFDFLSPDTDRGDLSRPGDWLHTNALHIGVSDNLLVSSAFLNQVFAITPDFSGLAWRLGGPNATLVPDSAATFAFQHTAAEIAEGRVVLFDNRGAQDGDTPYSRALELELDFAGGTATTAWVFRPPNDNYASIISSARRMANGNTMVGFGPGEGLVDSVGPIEVYEVALDGTIVWHLVVQGPNHMFRATPFSDIAGETVVS